MTGRPIATWQRIDREDLIRHVQRSRKRPGLYPIVGRDIDGREVAANLVAEVLEIDFALRVIRIPQRNEASPRHLLCDAWAAVHGPVDDHDIPPWVSTRTFITVPEVCSRISARLGSRKDTAFVFDTVDYEQGIKASGVKIFETLALDVGAPVYVASRRESGTRWRNSSPFPLKKMHVTDARATLQPVRSMLGLSLDDIDSIEAMLASSADRGKIGARDMYDVVSAHLLGSAVT